jgi:hypothetical protein
MELNEVTSTTNQKAKSTLDLTNMGSTQKDQEQLGDPNPRFEKSEHLS